MAKAGVSDKSKCYFIDDSSEHLLLPQSPD